MSKQGSAGQGACILVHPLENIQPVAADGGTWSGDELVVWSSIDIPYLLTFNQVSGIFIFSKYTCNSN